jgi:hypothetical protein
MAVVTTILMGPGAPAQAGGRPDGPQLTINGFSGPTPADDPEQQWQWTLAVTAQDPDGVVVEVEVRWGDGAIAYAHTYCVFTGDPGTPVDMRIPHSYAAPGAYTVRARAVTLPTCWADWDEHETTRWVTTRVDAAPPPTA